MVPLYLDTVRKNPTYYIGKSPNNIIGELHKECNIFFLVAQSGKRGATSTFRDTVWQTPTCGTLPKKIIKSYLSQSFINRLVLFEFIKYIIPGSTYNAFAIFYIIFISKYLRLNCNTIYHGLNH